MTQAWNYEKMELIVKKSKQIQKNNEGEVNVLRFLSQNLIVSNWDGKAAISYKETLEKYILEFEQGQTEFVFKGKIYDSIEIVWKMILLLEINILSMKNTDDLIENKIKGGSF